MVIITGSIILIPFHLLKWAFQAIWAYLCSWLNLDTYYLDAFYAQQIEMYEQKRKALQDYNSLF